MPNQSAAANRRLAGQSDGAGNLAAIVAADRALPAAVAELGRRRLTMHLPYELFDRQGANQLRQKTPCRQLARVRFSGIIEVLGGVGVPDSVFRPAVANDYPSSK